MAIKWQEITLKVGNVVVEIVRFVFFKDDISTLTPNTTEYSNQLLNFYLYVYSLNFVYTSF